MKLTPKRTFLLRREAGKDVVAKRGIKIEVMEAEHRKFPSYFVEAPPSNKRGLSVK